MKSPKPPKSNSSKSPVGWYLGSVVLKFCELTGYRKTRKRNLVWENTYLIRAKTAASAYQKLVTQGKAYEKPYTNTDGIEVRFKFAGVGFLLPVYEKLADGVELIWTDHGKRTEAQIRKLVKPKRALLRRCSAV